MTSVHEDYGRGWHRPWLVLLVVFIPITIAHVLLHDRIEASQVVCKQNAKSRFRAFVQNGLVWTADLPAALDCARRHNRRVLLAIHAISDVSALVNETVCFRDASVRSAMKKYVLVMLLTDTVRDQYYHRVPTKDEKCADAEANLAFEQRAFETVQEPYYVVLQPMSDGGITVVATYDEARINDLPRFLRFLREHF